MFFLFFGICILWSNCLIKDVIFFGMFDVVCLFCLFGFFDILDSLELYLLIFGFCSNFEVDVWFDFNEFLLLKILFLDWIGECGFKGFRVDNEDLFLGDFFFFIKVLIINFVVWCL